MSLKLSDTRVYLEKAGEPLALRAREVPVLVVALDAPNRLHSEREFFIDNLLVRIHLIIKMILVDRPCAMGVWIPTRLHTKEGTT